jgi:hypothetical protein
MQRAQGRKIPSRIFADRRLPIRRERAGAECEDYYDRALHWPKSGSNEHFRSLRPLTRRFPVAWAPAFHLYEKIHASLARVYFRIVERKLRFRSSCRRDRWTRLGLPN